MRALFVLVVLVLVGLDVAGQVYDRPLTEQDLQRIAPLVSAEKAGAARLARQGQEREALEAARAKAREQAVNAIEGGADPLEWLAKVSPNAIAPSTARYQAACSQALTKNALVPSAVFSFGIAAPPSWLAVWHARDEGLPIADRTKASEAPGAQRPGATRPESVVQQTRAFYSNRQFEYQGEPAPFEWQFVGPNRLVSATVMGVNVLGRVEPCRTLASGPMIVLKAEGEAFGKGPAQTPSAANRELAEALDKAGMAEGEYLNLKMQLFTAQADTGDPSRLKTPATANEEQQKELEIRRRNAEFYRSHEAEIALLLQGLARY